MQSSPVCQALSHIIPQCDENGLSNPLKVRAIKLALENVVNVLEVVDTGNQHKKTWSPSVLILGQFSEAQLFVVEFVILGNESIVTFGSFGSLLQFVLRPVAQHLFGIFVFLI